MSFLQERKDLTMTHSHCRPDISGKVGALLEADLLGPKGVWGEI